MALLQGLQHSSAAKTIETLVISDTWPYKKNGIYGKGRDDDTEQEFMPIKSLKKLERLNLLILDQTAIWRKGKHPGAKRHETMITNLIPTSLQQLFLVSNPQFKPQILNELDLTDELLELARQTRYGNFPFLRGVYLSGFFLRGADKVSNAFDGTGVTFLFENITTPQEWYAKRMLGIRENFETFVVRDKTTGKDLIRVKC
ncbi:hypothetical protein QBC38DRAFT_445820 [Podospora fimiseda]|uniref:Uncharacterized protein n=1 Tax=Podospora fimiseda TaxID=252190 RepID=A0AAN7BKA3_9PEZI|nr:hypothetical protein QBC38DRAFT_445820 [Podospora fimiseda]